MAAIRTRAPGRVNLIGEHTDYNDGFVLPCAIAPQTQVLATPRDDRRVTARSVSHEPASFYLDRLPETGGSGWQRYVLGILRELLQAGVELRGADLAISGTVPLGAGLSSSASLEIAVALAMLAIAQAALAPIELARLAQRAETTYAGTRCGIMDQCAVLFARRGHALLLDTRTLAYEAIPVPDGAAIVLCNTMVKHELAGSAYNERRAQCERSVELLQPAYPGLRALRDLPEEQLSRAAALLPPPLAARTRHVVSENARVLRAAQALRTRDLTALGALMNASHESLRADYEVSCTELDVLVTLARDFEGTFGARMTGGGFGGCTVNLVRASRAEEFRAFIAAAYERETGIVPELYDGTPSDGAQILA